MDRLIANRVLNLCFASQEYLQGHIDWGVLLRASEHGKRTHYCSYVCGTVSYSCTLTKTVVFFAVRTKKRRRAFAF